MLEYIIVLYSITDHKYLLLLHIRNKCNDRVYYTISS